ncbi:MAG TPA: adenylate/guanylate cyclase domain-containing protein [Bacteroidales bacterium]|nr:adenylate/guanylate cyclase domain-containing protein [Bacteroidales bacterium]HPO66290.1 adenylate/guanylate cyclase domain-containing protein [Bacteroidales bacterium]
MSESYEELVRRIAKLVKQNKELKEENNRLHSLYEKLQDENEQLKKLLGKYQATLELPGEKDEQKTLRFQMATVLFANIHGFSRLNDKIDSQKVIDQLDSIMFHFENVIHKYKIEKIKTIGDTLMCAGGIPQKNITNPVEVVLAALEMVMIVDEIQHQSDNDKIWEIKMGIHTGPVTATLGGNKKSTYELKGDTVNIATRLESSGVPGNIIISANTYELVKEFFTCEYMGKMPIKYHGDIDIYLVKGIKPELSVNEQGKVPNDLFRTRFGLLQFNDLQEIILDRLEKELPPYLYYHNVKHTVDVITEVELIGWGEGVSDEEILLLKTAALFHDSGHIISYDNHEYFGTVLAREYLPKFNYTNEQIEIICELIMATKLPPKPKNLLEKIMCDADLDYLGRSDFIPVSNTLYRELKEQNKIGSLNDWNKLQLKFISGHQYFTQTALSLREVNKQKQIERIMQLIEPEPNEPQP